MCLVGICPRMLRGVLGLPVALWHRWFCWFGFVLNEILQTQNHKDREREFHPCVNLHREKQLQLLLNCVRVMSVSCTSNLFLMLILNLPDVETILICIVVLCFPHNNIVCIHVYDECKRSKALNVCVKILSILYEFKMTVWLHLFLRTRLTQGLSFGLVLSCRKKCLSGHPRPSRVRSPVYRWCPSRDPLGCHRVQDESVTKRQPIVLVVGVVMWNDRRVHAHVQLRILTHFVTARASLFTDHKMRSTNTS